MGDSPAAGRGGSVLLLLAGWGAVIQGGVWSCCSRCFTPLLAWGNGRNAGHARAHEVFVQVRQPANPNWLQDYRLKDCAHFGLGSGMNSSCSLQISLQMIAVEQYSISYGYKWIKIADVPLDRCKFL